MKRNDFGSGSRTPARPGDGFVRLEFLPTGEIDIAAVLGAEPARTGMQRDVRNALIVVLLLGSWKDPERWYAYSRDRNAYADSAWYYGRLASYDHMIWSVCTLERVGLIENRKTRPGPHKSLRSTIKATERLVEESPLANVGQLRRVISRTVRLKTPDGALTRYRETSETRDWHRDIAEQNEAISGLHLTFTLPDWRLDRHGLLRTDDRVLNPACCQHYRVFNGDWRSGGRWYGTFWQSLCEADRERLRIDGQQIRELDYPQFHPTLLAAIAGIDLGAQDFYLIPGFPRKDGKVAVNTLINATKGERSAALALAEGFRELHREPYPYAMKLIEAIKSTHPRFAEFWGTGVGCFLQRVDSDMCAAVQRRMRKLGEPVLSVHDSFIAKDADAPRLHEVMADVLEQTRVALAHGDKLPHVK